MNNNAIDFRKYIKSHFIKKNDRILEFGPLERPIVDKIEYPNAYYADIKSTEEIKKLYTSNEYLNSTGISVNLDSIVDIDYVINKSYKETFKKEKKFDVVYLSHVIEHMPDILDFFDDIASIIDKDGKLIIIYPDARYCFDHFRNGTSFIDAYDVYKNKKINCNAVFDFTYNVIHENDPGFFWNETNIVDKLPRNKFTNADDTYIKASNNETPDDVHYWPFSDYQFIKFLYDTERAGLSKFEINYFYKTQYNTQEFLVVLSLKKSNKINYRNYEKILSNISPAIKNVITSKENKNINDELIELKKIKDNIEKENRMLQKELEDIYNSKRWKVITKVANIKNKLIK
ncbi:MAG TPA: methyltransferase domain-containing protein [Candidatus Saccharibacteria bacterium]|nr:methyltransferase domain-containing protein [Candidatus Saccharibacteria bacterium]